MGDSSGESDRSPPARAEEAPQAGEERYRMALEAAGHGYFELDTRSARIVAGAPWVAIGYGPQDLTPSLHAWTPLVHPEDRAAVLEALDVRQRGRAAAVQRVEYRMRGKDGSWRAVLVSTRVLSRDLDGIPMRIVGTMTDVTEARALRERVADADRLSSLGRLAAGVAHAVNNPLTSVASSLRVLQEHLERLRADPSGGAGPIAELCQEAADAAQGSERVREVVRALQLFASPRAAAARERVDVVAELQAALDLTRNAVSERARLSVEIPVPLSPVMAVPGELAQAFLNLLLGAADAIPEGRASENEVRVATRAESGRVIVEFRDTGAEISREHLPRVFEPFFAARSPDGGLGLSVCHGVVTAAGGAIEVESEPGAGTMFRVTLPAAVGPAAQSTPAPAPRGRVLVVDDDALVGRSMGRLLQASHDVTVVSSGAEAIARIEAGERWDVILCDLMMPELSGMDVGDWLARSAPELLPRVIYLTGGAFTDRARQFLDGRPHLEKPVDVATLRARVAELVRRVR